MKSLYKIIFILAATALIAVSCSDDDDKAANVDSVKILETDQDTIYLDKGDVYKVQIETTPPNQAVKYYTSDANIFTVSIDGTITALEGGSASLLIAAPSGDSWINTKCVINITAYVESIVTSNIGYIMIAEGQTSNVSSLFTAHPNGATNKKLIYKSSNPAIATVDESGVVTPVSKGIAEITASPADGKNNIVSEPIKVYSKYSTNMLNKSGWTATASDQHSYYPASRIIDGSNYSFWHNNYSVGTPPPYTLLVDMKSLKDFNKVTVWRRLYYTDTKTVEIYISEKTEDGVMMDDISFTKIGDFEFGDLPSSTTNLTLDYWLNNETYQSRYIKLILPNTNRDGNNSLAEIYLYNVE